MIATRRSVLLGSAAALLATTSSEVNAATVSRPNFLFILADDMGWADLSCYGREDYETPHIDRLAREGVRFTQAYANSAVCTATRVGLITGRYQYRLPIGLEEPLGLRPIGLSPNHPTIASLLRDAGYRTSLIGKWHLGALPNYGPLQSGYDEFWGFRGGGVDYFTHRFANEDDLWDGDTPVSQAGYLTDLLADRAIEKLRRYANVGTPFLMSLHFSAPHWPWEGPHDSEQSERLAKDPSPLALMDQDGGSMATYAAIVKRLDDQVGRIMAALRRLKLDKNTVVVFTSDNGGERFSKTWPFSGRKTELLEGGIRVPCIVRWPGISRPGSISDAQIMSMDWLPTFVAAAGGHVPSAFLPDGIDIRSAIAGRGLPERPLFWRYKFLTQRAVRLGDWKYLRIAGNEFLFNLVIDPMERANLKSRYPEKFKELIDLWRNWDRIMLPLDPESTTHGQTGDIAADRNGGTISPLHSAVQY